MLRKMMEVLELFSLSRPEVGAMEAAKLLGRPKSTVARWLTAIADAGLLERDPHTGLYRLSLRLASLAEISRRSTTIQQVARIELEALSLETGETSNLVMPTSSLVSAVNVVVVESMRPVRHLDWVGRHLPSHASAAAKALLAQSPEEDVRAGLPLVLAKCASRTITDLNALCSELEDIRTKGYALGWAELEDDLAAIGAPVYDHAGKSVAALAIGAPISRAPIDTFEETYSLPVMRAARRLSERLGFRPTD